MAIYEKGKETYKGQVVGSWDHMWMDGMLEEYADVWNLETHTIESFQVGYYGSDGQNLCATSFKIDYTPEVALDMVRTYTARGHRAFDRKVEEDKHTVRKNDRVRVVRGRKVAKGTELTVFWIGERPDYMGYHMEKIAGCWDDAGNKVWIRVDYLEVLTKRPEPTEEEREDFVQDYLKDNLRRDIREAARRAG